MSALKTDTPTGAIYKDADRDCTKHSTIIHLKVINVESISDTEVGRG